MEDLGGTKSSQLGTVYSTKLKGPRYLSLAEGYILEEALDENDNIIGYKYCNTNKMMKYIKEGMDPKEAIDKSTGTYGRYNEASKYIDPRED